MFHKSLSHFHIKIYTYILGTVVLNNKFFFLSLNHINNTKRIWSFNQQTTIFNNKKYTYIVPKIY